MWSFTDSGSTPILGRTSPEGFDYQELNVHFAKVVNDSGMWSCWDGISWGECLGITCPLSLVRNNHFTQTTLFPPKGFWHWLVALRRCMRFKTQIFMIWCFDLNIYALILFWKISFFFEKCVQDCNKPKLTEMGEGFVEIIPGWVTRPNLGSSVLDGRHSQYPKAFTKIH